MNSDLIPLIAPLLLGAALAYTGQVKATEREEARWYEVELIIFEHTTPEALLAEKWPVNPGYPSSAGLIELRSEKVPSANQEANGISPAMPNTNTGQAYRRLDAKRLNLTKQFEKLQASPHHRPLFHTAWRMQVPPRDKPARIHLNNGIARLLPETPKSMTPQSSAAQSTSDIPMAAPVIAANSRTGRNPNQLATRPAIDGVISISIARYLHIDLDLLFRSPEPLPSGTSNDYWVMPEPIVAPNDHQADEPNSDVVTNAQVLINDLIRVQGNLRMRSKEVHYLDHPKVGMIIQFLPYEPPATGGKKEVKP